MKSRTTPAFWRCYRALPESVRALARKAYERWSADPRHPGLQFKPVDPSELVYSVRVGGGYRALGRLDGDTVTWFWIGSHADYDRLT
jgi:hypothetical protein